MKKITEIFETPLNENELFEIFGGDVYPGPKDPLGNLERNLDAIWSFCRGVYNAISN